MNEIKFKIERNIILVEFKIVERKTTKERKLENKQLQKRIEERNTIKLMNELCKT